MVCRREIATFRVDHEKRIEVIALGITTLVQDSLSDTSGVPRSCAESLSEGKSLPPDAGSGIPCGRNAPLKNDNQANLSSPAVVPPTIVHSINTQLAD
jgi:hypothetical protein